MELKKLSTASSVARFNNAARVALVQCWDVVRRSGLLEQGDEDIVELIESEGAEKAGLKLLDTVVKIAALRQNLAQKWKAQQQVETNHSEEMMALGVVDGDSKYIA